MSLSEYNALVHYWCEHPPVHLLLGAFFGAAGGESKSHTTTRRWTPADDPDVPSYRNESWESLVMRLGRTPGVGRRA